MYVYTCKYMVQIIERRCWCRTIRCMHSRWRWATSSTASSPAATSSACQVRCRATRENIQHFKDFLKEQLQHLKDFCLENGSSQGRNLALTVSAEFVLFFDGLVAGSDVLSLSGLIPQNAFIRNLTPPPNRQIIVSNH